MPRDVFEHEPGLPADELWYADCKHCDWSQIAPNEQVGRTVEVLHLLVKHEPEYYKETGRHPEDAKKLYAEFLGRYMRYL